MLQIIYDFWVQECPFLAPYGDWTYMVATIMTIYAFLRICLVYPLYALGFRKRL